MKVNIKEEFKIFFWITIIIAMIFPLLFSEKLINYLWGNLFIGIILGALISIILDKGIDLELGDWVWTIKIEELNISTPITLLTILVFIIKNLIIL